MLILIFFTYLVINISLIKCNDTIESIHVIIDDSDTCDVNQKYVFPEWAGVLVILHNKSNRVVDMAKADKYENDQSKNQVLHFNKNGGTALRFLYIPSYNKTYDLFFKFTYVLDQSRNKTDVHPMCNTTVSFDPTLNELGRLGGAWFTLYVAISGILAVIIIIALSATTLFYKRKVNMLSKHINLKIRTERADDNERYCSNPRKGKKVSPIINKNRDSDIYEDPQITLGVSSIPPALPTSPRPNRGNCSTLKVPSSTSLPLKSNVSSQSSLPSRKAIDKEPQTKISIAKRPPLPLPQDDVYSETQDETYEEPPIPERPPPPTLSRKFGQRDRIATIPQTIAKPGSENFVKPTPENMIKQGSDKVTKSLEKKFGQKLPNIPMDALKPPGMNLPQKPAVPKGKPTPPRNNVVQVPIRQIPETSTIKKPKPVKPKPNEQPRQPPSPTIEQEAQYYDDNRRDSTDSEYWTYEPLQQYHIYNN